MYTHTPIHPWKWKYCPLKGFKLVPVRLLKSAAWQTVYFNESCSHWKERMQQALCYFWVGKGLFKSGAVSEGQIHKHKGSVMHSSGVWIKIVALDLISRAQGLTPIDARVGVSNCLPSWAITASRAYTELWLVEKYTILNHADHILKTLRCSNTVC